MKIIYSKVLDYLKLKMSNFKTDAHGGRITVCTCPVCGEMSCNIVPNTNMLHCLKCNKDIGDIIDFVRKFEVDKKDFSNDEILEYLADLFKVSIVTDYKKMEMFDYYSKQGFDLVPIQTNGKAPIEKNWPEKSHKSIEEWQQWTSNNLNIGVKTGKISNLTVLDIDTKDIPIELKDLLSNYKGLLQESSKGYHYFFRYDSDLPKTRIDKYKLDLQNDGGQVVIFPSIVDGVYRKILSYNDIPTLDKNLKQFLLNNISIKCNKVTTLQQTVDQKIASTSEVISINEGNRTNFLIQLGGLIRKELNNSQTGYIVDLVNKHFVNPSLSKQEVNAVINSLCRYTNLDENSINQKILKYIGMMGEATAHDVKEVIEEKKEVIDKSLSFLQKEGFIIKRRRMYHAIKKASWKDVISDNLNNEIKFKISYFSDMAVLNEGDLVLLGSGSKSGKTTIAVNILRELVDQGIKPYYISLETGSRFQKTALQLGLKDGDFFWDFQADPTKIELEKNAVTIIDWLMIEDKANTDGILKHFVEQLFKTNGFLIIFMQLKKDGTWFAPNLVEHFPALGARYLYEKPEDGTYGKWIVNPIREPKGKLKTVNVPCQYDYETKRLTVVTDVNDLVQGDGDEISFK